MANVAPPMLLTDLTTDSLRSLFEHVDVPFPLKLTCTALRDAAPRRTQTAVANLAKWLKLMKWAVEMKMPTPWVVCPTVARAGTLEVLQWAVDQGCALMGNQTFTAAAKRGHMPMLQWLWDDPRCPVGDLRAPINQAAASGHIQVLNFLHNVDETGFPHRRAEGPEKHKMWAAAVQAARNGHVHVLAWLQLANYPIQYSAATAAVGDGHIPVLHWLHDNVKSMRDYCNDGGVDLCAEAGQHGQLDVLKWLRALGCEWDDLVCTFAAYGGHQELLTWAVDNGAEMTEEVIGQAVYGGHFDVAKWAHARGVSINRDVCAAAARKGRLDIVQWARAQGGAWSTCVITEAVRKGFFDIAQWARANGCAWNSSACSAAAVGNHLEILQWLRSGPEPCDWGVTCTQAARYGHLNLLKWARAHGAPWNQSTTMAAASNGHLEVLKWLRNGFRANPCPWDSGVCLQFVSRNDVGSLEWAISNGCPTEPNTTRWCRAAAIRGNLKMLQFLRSGPNHCYPWDITVVERAAYRDQWRCVLWAVQNGCPHNAQLCLQLATATSNSTEQREGLRLEAQAARVFFEALVGG